MKLLTHLLRFRVKLHAYAGAAQHGGHLEVIHKPLGAELHHEHRGSRGDFLQKGQLLHGGQQPVQAERGADARQGLPGIQTGEVVIAAARADAADAGQVRQRRLINGARVIIEAAGDRQVEVELLVGQSSRASHVDEFA